MQMFPEDKTNLWAACDGQEDEQCAVRCYARYFSGAPQEHDADVFYWAGWVKRRMQHVREVCELVDLYIAPAHYLLKRYRNEFCLPESKLRYLDYGFDLQRFSQRLRVSDKTVTFGYIGTHIPAKGIHNLIKAFGQIKGDASLKIWGRARGQDTEALKSLAQSLPASMSGRIEWMGEYRNQDIVTEVFNHIDAIVVPSVWVENSPLVIHEAQQARVPVVTADAGGMGEYVHHNVNGLLFHHRSVESLTQQMQQLVDVPELAARLGSRGYIYSDSGDIPGIKAHVKEVEGIYQELIGG